MPPTQSLLDCRRLAEAVLGAGGKLPDVLGYILTADDLIAAQRGAERPERAIVAAAIAGELDEDALEELVIEGSRAERVADYRGNLRRSLEPLLVEAWHRQLRDSAAGEILESLRPQFDLHRAAIDEAKSAGVGADSSAEFILSSGDSRLVKCWQGLDRHLAVIAKIGAVASQFGPRLGSFPLVAEYHLADNAKLTDQAIMCTSGPVEVDSSVFRVPDRGHRTSPWYRVPLHLNTIAEAQARVDQFSAAEFDRIHGGDPGGYIDGDGRMVQHERPANPYRVPEPAKG